MIHAKLNPLLTSSQINVCDIKTDLSVGQTSDLCKPIDRVIITNRAVSKHSSFYLHLPTINVTDKPLINC